MWQVFICLHLMLILQNLVKNKPNIQVYQKMDHLSQTTTDIEKFGHFSINNNAGSEQISF